MRPEVKPFDTMSEVSDGTGGTSLSGRGSYFGDSREDLRDLIAKLGPEFHEERFRVDRRKLEEMIAGEDEACGTAEDFFKKIQEDTKTVVIWPSRLKIGAKSKKDPHIRIAGRIEKVRIAKRHVIDVLDARSNRVTMKLDVSYTDHSHIIGRKGETIQGVMLDTGCHIHFPDSNRNNSAEKSNQVSIAGEMDGVERARQGVRLLTPLIFCFELPIVGSLETMPDATKPDMVEIQQKYNVQVSFRTRPKLHATLVVVKGLELELEKVKEATLVLINHMCENFASQVLVQMTMEISPQHHSVVLGENRINLKVIMQITGCKIMFPDADDPNIPLLKKSNVTIIGMIHNVYLARQMLVGSLPLVVMFDLPESIHVDAEHVSQLMQALGVGINIRNKPKQSTLSVVIRGIERNASNIYEARHRLLHLESSPIRATVPPSYEMSLDLDMNQFPTLHTGYGFYPITPLQSPLSPVPPSFGQIHTLHPSQFGHLFPPQLMMHQLAQGFMPSYEMSNNSSSSGYGSRSSLLSDNTKDNAALSSLSSTNSTLSSPSVSPRNISPMGPYMDNMSGLGQLNPDYIALDKICQTDETKPKGLASYDYDQKKVKAAKARQQQLIPGELRTPTNIWAGSGLSQSSSSSMTSYEDPSMKNDPWQIALGPSFNITDYSGSESARSLSASNPFDATSPTMFQRICNAKAQDITTHLTLLRLDKYIDLFLKHEIDMTMFCTLSDVDLREMGVTALGARRKMLMSISELKRGSKIFNARLAPGAERKSMDSDHKTTLSRNW